jgi:oligosaccharide repeat unit polymerase
MKPRSPRPVQARFKTALRADARQATHCPCPEPTGTLLFIFFLLMTGLSITQTVPSEMAQHAAFLVGAGLILSAVLDARYGIANLLRADLMALAALYFLTLFEFLFPQPKFNELVDRSMTQDGINACLCGFAAVAVGRHIFARRSHNFIEIFVRPVSTGFMLGVFAFTFVLGYFNMVMSVNFDVFELFHQFMEPRFSQPWARGKLGDWFALLYEFSLLIYLIPPLAGVVLAQRKRYKPFPLFLVLCGLALTLFYGFTSGTRNIFVTYLVTFCIAYAISAGYQRRKEVVIILAASAALIVFSTTFMLNFRNIGFSNYVNGAVAPPEDEKTMFVDYNLFVISHLTQYFPARYAYLEWEIPYVALIRPIPRALWPGKPEGLSMGIEEAMGVEGLTLASSFIGEAWMAYGTIGVLAVGLALGALTGWWSTLASPRNSDLGVLVYASGFFAAVISMRSLFVFTTAILPTIAILVLASFLIEKRRQRKDAFAAHAASRKRT